MLQNFSQLGKSRLRNIQELRPIRQSHYNLTKTVSGVIASFYFLGFIAATAADFYVSPGGNDSNPGTKDQPFATIGHARDIVRTVPQRGKEPIHIILHGGTYHLPETIVFTNTDSGTKDAPIEYRAADGEEPVIDGGYELKGLHWTPYKNGIMQSPVPGNQVPADVTFDQLFVNDKMQILARYPNYDPNEVVYNGYAPDAISPDRVKRWADPRGGFIHMQHQARWGSMDFLITGKDSKGDLTYEGGWQVNRKSGMTSKYRFVENIFEELDQPGEWFFDKKSSTLYFYPPSDISIEAAKFEGVKLRTLLEFQGSQDKPVRFLTISGLAFRHATRTFMETKEGLAGSDWSIARVGAVFFNGAEDCQVRDCSMYQLGGNAVFVNKYNRRITIRGCHLSELGASGVCFVGDPEARRAPNRLGKASLETMDKIPGPKTPNYPDGCLVEDCLIHDIGRIEKQPAGVEIDLSQHITVRHCSIYNTPRAGLNIGGGCWGGHVIEYCDVFNTVLETPHDHGCFNSWGRDRWWVFFKLPPAVDNAVAACPQLPFLDVCEPNIIRNSRWRCDNGYDIDLDDGSTNYHIYNNLCLGHGIKLADGYRCIVENNVTVHNTITILKWYLDHTQSAIRYNILFNPFFFTAKSKKGIPNRVVDYNILHSPNQKPIPATALTNVIGLDEHSLCCDALFVDPEHGNYSVKKDSPALKLGFKNFPMDQFGVLKPELKRIAQVPQLSVASKLGPTK